MWSEEKPESVNGSKEWAVSLFLSGPYTFAYKMDDKPSNARAKPVMMNWVSPAISNHTAFSFFIHQLVNLLFNVLQELSC